MQIKYCSWYDKDGECCEEYHQHVEYVCMYLKNALKLSSKLLFRMFREHLTVYEEDESSTSNVEDVLGKALLVSGVLHDVGKLTENYIAMNKRRNPLFRHEVVSSYIVYRYLTNRFFGKVHRDVVSHPDKLAAYYASAVLLHHEAIVAGIASRLSERIHTSMTALHTFSRGIKFDNIVMLPGWYKYIGDLLSKFAGSVYGKEFVEEFNGTVEFDPDRVIEAISEFSGYVMYGSPVLRNAKRIRVSAIHALLTYADNAASESRGGAAGKFAIELRRCLTGWLI